VCQLVIDFFSDYSQSGHLGTRRSTQSKCKFNSIYVLGRWKNASSSLQKLAFCPMLMIESCLSDTMRWVASSGYVADDNGFGLEVEMPQNLHLS